MALVIKPDSWFWRLYQHRYTVVGRVVEEPKGLCNYFWASIWGAVLWLRFKLSVPKTLLRAFVCFVGPLLLKEWLGYHHWVALYVGDTILLISVGLFFLTAMVGMNRFRDWMTVQEREHRLLSFTALVVLVPLLAWFVITHMDEHTIMLLKIGAWGIGIAIALSFLTATISFLPRRIKRKLGRFAMKLDDAAQVVKAQVIATKEGYCPQVEAPAITDEDMVTYLLRPRKVNVSSASTEGEKAEVMIDATADLGERFRKRFKHIKPASVTMFGVTISCPLDLSKPFLVHIKAHCDCEIHRAGEFAVSSS